MFIYAAGQGPVDVARVVDGRGHGGRGGGTGSNLNCPTIHGGCVSAQGF
jgi:hypothetical protein